MLGGVFTLFGIHAQGARGQELTAEADLGGAEEAPAETDSLPEPKSPAPDEPDSDEKGEPAPPPVFPAESHLWGRFPTGSYRVQRTITETFNPDGSLLGKSVTTKHEVLKAVADDAYVLDVKAAVDLDGKQVAGDWKTRALKLATDNPGRVVESADLGTESVEINGEPLACRLWEFRYAEENETVLQQTHFNADRFPYAMRIRRASFSGEEEGEPEETLLMEITAMPAPSLLRGRIVSGCRTRWTRRSSKGRSIRSVFLCESVPGGAVEATSTDIDTEGRRVRHSVTELVDYGIGQPDGSGSADGQKPAASAAESAAAAASR